MLRYTITTLHTPQILLRKPTPITAITIPATPLLSPQNPHTRLSSTLSTQHPSPSKIAVPKEPTPVTSSPTTPGQQQRKKKKTIAELDAELREKLEEMSGDGGVSGLELENGKPVAMKRGVRENMFRVI